MRTIDFSPLFRHSVGFERMQRLLDASARMESSAPSFPPYNIEQMGEDTYRISLTVAGFNEQDLDVTVEESTLVVTGRLAEDSEDKTLLHRGIAGGAFERRFELADHIKVVGGSLVNGLLNIDLERGIPEEKRLRKIVIETKEAKRIDKKAA